jgi:hypothetical protein
MGRGGGGGARYRAGAQPGLLLRWLRVEEGIPSLMLQGEAQLPITPLLPLN